VTCIPYGEEEMELIKSMSQDGKKDEEICTAILEKMGIKRTIDSIARKRGREGITKLNIHNYIQAEKWSKEDVDFIRENFMFMNDMDLAVVVGRSVSAVQRIRSKYFLNRVEKAIEERKPPKKPEPIYEKHYIKGGMSDYERKYIESLKADRGTYSQPVQKESVCGVRR